MPRRKPQEADEVILVLGLGETPSGGHKQLVKIVVVEGSNQTMPRFAVVTICENRKADALRAMCFNARKIANPALLKGCLKLNVTGIFPAAIHLAIVIK